MATKKKTRRASDSKTRKSAKSTSNGKSKPAAVHGRWTADGPFPYEKKLKSKKYQKFLVKLQIELLKVQNWAKQTGQKIAIIFEGRDAAGKGGTIKRFTQHLNPRGARVVALNKPTDVERGQWYFQRYIAHLPTDGEIVFFDRVFDVFQALEHSWNDPGQVLGKRFPPSFVDFCRNFREVARFFMQSLDFSRKVKFFLTKSIAF